MDNDLQHKIDQMIDGQVEALRLKIWEAKQALEKLRRPTPFIYGEAGVSRYGQRSPLPSGDKE
jgi:hypothetical protein